MDLSSKLINFVDHSVRSVLDDHMPNSHEISLTPFFAKLNRASHTKPQIMWFHARWCGHCVRMEEAWQEASDSDVAEWHAIDCTDDRTMAVDMQVTSFPTIIKFTRGRRVEYDGERSSTDLRRFASS